MRLIAHTSRSRETMIANTAEAMFKGIRTITTLLLLAAFGWSTPVEAQNVSTTGQVRGRVVDEAGEPIAGVVITARNNDTGLERTSLTNNEGLYAVRLLPPGRYTVSTQVIGFAGESLDEVLVAIGSAASANFVLSVQAVEVAGIEVTADRARIDASDASVTQLVTVEQIEELPSLGRDFVDFIELSGMVDPDPATTTGGQFAIAGQRPSGTNIQIDGVDANNSFFGENRGGSRIPFVFSLESIEQFQIITNGFDVEYGAYSGGIVNVVTRGGTNELEGTVYGNIRDDAFVARGFENEDVGTFETQQFAGRLSGPIIRDRAHFLVSVDGQRRREPQIPLTPSNQDPELQDEIERFFRILEQQYGVDDAASGYQPFETTNDALTVFGRVDWQLGDQNRLSFRHNYSNHDNAREYTDFFDFTYGRSRAESFSSESHSFVTELQSVLGANSFNVLRFQWADENRPRQGQDVRPTLTVNVPGIDALNPSDDGLLRYGGTFVAFRNLLDERKLQVVDNFSHSMGDHTLKVGVNALWTRAFNRFQAPMRGVAGLQSAGEFSFESLDAFEAGRPSVYLRPFQEGQQISASEFDVVEWATYLQDEWRLSPKLTATLGLRYDQQHFSTTPSPVVDVERAFGFETGFAPTDSDNISPRVALAYDLDGDGRRVVRAGAGYFYGRIPLVLGGNVMQTERPVVELRCEGDPGDPDAPPDVSDYATWSPEGTENPFNCAGGSAGSRPTPSYSVWSPDFEYPETFRANLGYEGLVGERTRVAVDLLFSQGTNQYTVRNINLRPQQFTIAPEGRPVFTPLDLFSPGGGNEVASRISTEFADVYAIFSDGRNRAWLANIEASHNLTEDIRLSGSYTYNSSWDNISESCCTSNAIYANPELGGTSPNDLGDFGDTEKAWGRSRFGRDHTFILSGFATLPYDFKLGGFWRIQSGRRYTPLVDGDLNGDGIDDNDRPFIYAPSALPAASEEDRTAYASILEEHDCIGDQVGSFIERNTCSGPWTNRLDMRVTKSFATFGEQRAELQVDLFNVLNGIGNLFCDVPAEDSPEFDEFDFTEGSCGWGRVTTVTNTDVYRVSSFDRSARTFTFGVSDPEAFARERTLGDNLLLQFQMQLGFRYYF